MLFETPSVPDASDSGPWHRGLTRYHWFVLLVASLGWLFDTMDQQLFNLARTPAISELLPKATADTSPSALATRKKLVAEYGGYATAIFMVGWATGGLAFGVLGDRIGRARTMLLTILIYSLCTGLSALSVHFWDFCLYRFLTGLGVGGEFAVGVALVAEALPDRARPSALGWLQASSSVGNMLAALVGIGLGGLEQSGAIGASWRWMFVIGTLPALLAILIRRRLEEPEALEGRRLGLGDRGRGAEARIDLRAVRRPPLASQRDRRDAAGLLGRGRPLGDRLLQLRADPLGLPQDVRGAGPFRPRRSRASSPSGRGSPPSPRTPAHSWGSTPSARSPSASAGSRPSRSRSSWRWPRRPSPSGSSTSSGTSS